MKTLHDYQSQLQEKITTVTLLGQLPYSERDLERLRTEFETLCHDRTNGGWRTAADQYGIALALYLVLEGIYSYNAGAYWTKPSEVLRVVGPEQAEVGQYFRATLRSWQLPTFDHVGGQRHITPILAHAGIPVYCLDDYFNLLDRAARRDVMVDVPTLLDDWQVEGFPGQIDMPVQRFLLHGGPIAEDFVERCLELWQPDGLDRQMLELPPRVLEKFEKWWQDRSHKTRNQADEIQLTRPRIVADPYGEGIAFELPTVTYPVSRAPRSLKWRIEAGQRTREEGTFRRRLSDTYEYATDTGILNILTVADHYVLTLVADGVVLKSWNLFGAASPPLLAFDPKTGELILDRRRDKTEEYWISAGERWLLYPHGAALKPDNARKVAELPQQDGEWSRLQFESWLFEADARLDVILADEKTVSFCAFSDERPAPPSLLGHPLTPPGRQRQYTLYSGRPPDLEITHGQSGAQPERWRVTVSPYGPARPADKRTMSLDTLAHCIRHEENALILPLACPEILGERPFGEFRVHLRGPYGRRADFQIRIAPDLSLRHYPRRYFSDADGPTSLQLIVGEGSKPRVRQGQTGVTISEGRPVYPRGQSFSITASPDLRRIPLELRATDELTLDLDIPVYRLRWGLWQPGDPDTFAWQTRPLRLHPQAFANAHKIEIRVDLPLLEDAPRLTHGWRLIDTNGTILKEQPPDPDRPTKRYVQTRLAEWLDDFNHAGQMACLQLLVAIDGHPLVTPIDVVHLLPTLEMGNVGFAWDVGKDSQQLTLSWDNDVPVRNRALRLWPLDRPWHFVPVTLSLPEQSDGYAEWTLTLDELPAGEYLAEMIIDDPWASGPPARPAADEAHLFWICPEQWVALREHQIAAGARGELDGTSALALLHWAVRTDQLVDIQLISYGVQRGKSVLSFDQLLLWAELTRKANNSLAYKSAQLALYSDKHLHRLRDDDLTDEQRQTYLSHITGGLHSPALYRAAIHHTRGDQQWLCVAELCRLGEPDGFELVLEACRAESGRIEHAVEALLPNAEEAVDWLLAQDEPAAADLLHALVRRHRVSDLIHEGAEAATNAGVVKIISIQDQRTGGQRKVCRNRRNQAEPFILHGVLWPDDARIPVVIDLSRRSLSLSGKNLFPCTCCDKVYEDAVSLKAHLLRKNVIDFVRSPVNFVERPLSLLTVTKR